MWSSEISWNCLSIYLVTLIRLLWLTCEIDICIFEFRQMSSLMPLLEFWCRLLEFVLPLNLVMLLSFTKFMFPTNSVCHYWTSFDYRTSYCSWTSFCIQIGLISVSWWESHFILNFYSQFRSSSISTFDCKAFKSKIFQNFQNCKLWADFYTQILWLLKLKILSLVSLKWFESNRWLSTSFWPKLPSKFLVIASFEKQKSPLKRGKTFQILIVFVCCNLFVVLNQKVLTQIKNFQRVESDSWVSRRIWRIFSLKISQSI